MKFLYDEEISRFDKALLFYQNEIPSAFYNSKNFLKFVLSVRQIQKRFATVKSPYLRNKQMRP